MSRKTNPLLIVIGIIVLIETMVEYLALPAIFLVLGLIYDLPWQYYAWSMGGYVAILIFVEIAGALIGCIFGKVFELRIVRKLRSAAEHNKKTR